MAPLTGVTAEKATIDDVLTALKNPYASVGIGGGETKHFAFADGKGNYFAVAVTNAWNGPSQDPQSAVQGGFKGWRTIG